MYRCCICCLLYTGMSEWEDDRLLAAVLAASQQEYIESLKQDHNTDN